jgi:hypothetical protein
MDEWVDEWMNESGGDVVLSRSSTRPTLRVGYCVMNGSCMGR